jgi:hypothetical protein
MPCSMVGADFIKKTGKHTLCISVGRIGGVQIRCLDLEEFKSMHIV